MLKRIFATLVAALLFGTALTACSPSGIQSGTSISIAQTDDFNSLNADNVTTEASLAVNHEVSNLINPSFFFVDSDGQLVANEKFGKVEIVSKKPFKLSYSLSGDAAWSDGQKVTARDLMLSWLAARNPADSGFNTVRAGSGLRWSTGIPIISADGLSLEITFDRAVADWQSALTVTAAAHLVAKQAFGLSDVNSAFSRFDEAISSASVAEQSLLSKAYAELYLVRDGLSEAAKVSAGAYVVQSHADGSALTLKANPTFTWGPAPRIETITIKFYSDSTAMLAAMQNGEVDICAPLESGIATNSDLINLANAAGAKYEFAASNYVEAVLLNFAEASVFADGENGSNALLRESFLKLMPRAKILTALSVDNPVIEARSWIYSNGSNYYTPFIESNGSSDFLVQNAERAQELLVEAKLDTPVDIRVLFDADNPRAKSEFNLLNEYAAGVGFNLVDVSTNDPRTVFALGEFDAFITTVPLAGEISGDPYWFTGGSVGQFKSTTVDDLLTRYSSQEDALDQIAVLKEIDAELYRAQFGLPLYQVPSLLVYSERIATIIKAPFGQSATYGYWNWTLAR
jgi:peptide/nickel transport system substrate-binding protein